jgi:hypothetical protein
MITTIIVSHTATFTHCFGACHRDPEYRTDEYVTVNAGLSPDGKFAITAHGSSDYDGYHGFHLYLTDAITGKKIGVLNGIVDSLTKRR